MAPKLPTRCCILICRCFAIGPSVWQTRPLSDVVFHPLGLGYLISREALPTARHPPDASFKTPRGRRRKWAATRSPEVFRAERKLLVWPRRLIAVEPGQKPLRAAAHRPARRLTFFCG